MLLELCLGWSKPGKAALWRRLARAPEAVAGLSAGRPLAWERRASQPGGARADLGHCQGGALTMLLCRAQLLHGLRLGVRESVADGVFARLAHDGTCRPQGVARTRGLRRAWRERERCTREEHLRRRGLLWVSWTGGRTERGGVTGDRDSHRELSRDADTKVWQTERGRQTRHTYTACSQTHSTGHRPHRPPHALGTRERGSERRNAQETVSRGWPRSEPGSPSRKRFLVPNCS